MEKMEAWTRAGPGKKQKVERYELHFGVRVTRFAQEVKYG